MRDHLDDSKDEVERHSFLRDCSHQVGVCGRTVVILVEEDVSDSVLADICAFMRSG